MTGTAIATMVVICGLVWGGFATLLVRAMRREGQKQRGDGLDR
ncbi:MAG: MetS family NSS transporter small subunit [Acidobacteriota bacterium]